MKSLVMKHAWVLFRAGTNSFGECLKRAWAVAKAQVAPPIKSKPVGTGLSLRSNGEKVNVYLGGAWLCTVWGNDKAAVVAGIVELGKAAVGTELYRLRVAYGLLVPKNTLAILI